MPGPSRGPPRGRGGGRGRRRQAPQREEVTKEEEMEMYRESAPAKVIELVSRTGVRGEVMQVRCKVLAGYDKGKVLRRNVKGPIKIGDLIMLRDSEQEAAPLNRRKR